MSNVHYTPANEPNTMAISSTCIPGRAREMDVAGRGARDSPQTDEYANRGGERGTNLRGHLAHGEYVECVLI